MKHPIEAQNLRHLLTGEVESKGASFTVLSKATGKDYTFKIQRKEFKDRLYTHVKVEQGYLQFTRLGTYFDGVLKSGGVGVHTPAAEAAAWLLRQIEKQNFVNLANRVEIFHLGNCLRCGRTLTDAHSIDTGFGPHCRTIIGE